mgnify:FL=1
MSRFHHIASGIKTNLNATAVAVSILGITCHSAGYNGKCDTNVRNCYSYCQDPRARKSSNDCGQGNVYTPEEVQHMNGTGGKPFWVTYRGEVFDLTNFKDAHPGGKLIEQTAGKLALALLP